MTLRPLPYSRTVNVTLTRRDRFPTRRGFGTPMFLTSETGGGALSSTIRSLLFASEEEAVDAGFATTDETYKALAQAFAQKPRPVQIKVGFYDSATATTAAAMKTELDSLLSYDDSWYWLTHEAALRDTVMQDGINEWCESHPKFGILDTNDVLTKSAADLTCLAARSKNQFERATGFYDEDVDQYPALAYAAYLGTRNFDNPRSNYTGKYKRLQGLDPIYPSAAEITAITGFTPGLGQSSVDGHMCNALIDIGQQRFVVEGSTWSQNVFIDTIHASDWVIFRTEEALLALLLNNDAIPMTDEGMEIVAGAVRAVMQAATRAGLVAIDEDPVTGEYAPAVQITVPKIRDTTTAAQRANRIAPPVRCTWRYAGAMHYLSTDYFLEF